MGAQQYGGGRPDFPQLLEKLSTPVVKTIVPPTSNAVARQQFSGCRVKGTGTQTLTTAVDAILTWDAEDFDTDAFHSNVSNTSRLVAPFDGYYSIFGDVWYATNGTGSRWATILLNGATIIGEQSQMAVTTATYQTLVSAACIYKLSVGDYVELRSHQTSGGNLNVDKTKSFFGMALLGI